MADTYVYRVRDRSGALINGSLEADSTALVVSKLREMGFVPLSIDKKATTGLSADVKIPFVGDRVPLKDLAQFSRQFATMIDSGLTLLRALAILADQAENKALAQILRQVKTDVEQGASLSTALARHGKVFPRIYTAMVKAGESGGLLDSVLMQLAETLEKQVELRRKVKSAMTYPVAVLCLVSLILTAMLVFVVPQFKSMYSTLGGTLPLPTRILMAASRMAIVLIPVLLVAGVVGLVLFRRWIATPRGRALWDAFKLKVPLFGKITHKTALIRFCQTLAALIRAGVPLLEALEITKETAGNNVVTLALADMQEGVRGGESIASRLGAHPVFPPMVGQMIAVGEETGAVDSMLSRLGGFYEQEVEALVSALSSLLEPLLVVVLGGTVGTMVISLYLPMFRIINLIK